MVKSKYWQEREIIETQKLLDATIKATDERLIEMYEKTYDTVVTRLTELYGEIKASLKEGEEPLSKMYTYQKYYDVMQDIQGRLIIQGNRQNNLMTVNLTKLYRDNQKIVKQVNNFKVKIRDKKAAESAVKRIWVNDNLSYSQRIWNNQDILKTTIEEQLSNSLVLGDSVEKFGSAIVNRCNVHRYQAMRLARTELAHAQIQSTLDEYKDAGVKKYRFLTANDAVTKYNVKRHLSKSDKGAKGEVCMECSQYDGQLFDLADTEHLPPIHPNCRCTILAVIDGTTDAQFSQMNYDKGGII